MSPVSRRTFLVAPVALAIGSSITGCTQAPAPVLVDPDREALTVALGVEQELLLQSQTGPPLGREVSRGEVLACVQTHINRLLDTLGSDTTPVPTASSTTETPSRGTTSSDLSRAAAHAAASHTRASRSASPQTAQLLVSIAASDAAMAVALSEPQ